MSERARNLAQQLEQANQSLIATVEGLSDTQWRAKTPGDGRSVGVVAHHVATSHKSVAGLVGAIAHGHAVPTITMEMVHEGNAAHATQHANCTKAETLALLRQNGATPSSIGP
jgi:Mycothiol maleylpyruvate isomerase N-terminal domain